MLGGLSYASDLSQWLAYVPTDPIAGPAQLVASYHSYCGPPGTSTVAQCQAAMTSIESHAVAGRVDGGEIGARGDRRARRIRLRHDVHHSLHDLCRRRRHLLSRLGVESVQLRLLPRAHLRLHRNADRLWNRLEIPPGRAEREAWHPRFQRRRLQRYRLARRQRRPRAVAHERHGGGLGEQLGAGSRPRGRWSDSATSTATATPTCCGATPPATSRCGS